MSDKNSFQSEGEFIAWLRRRVPRRVAGLALGIGDDAAVVAAPPGQQVILTTDMSIEDVHFKLAVHPPRAVGHRAMARSLSDIAAMGGTPKYALISLATSPRTPRPWLEEFFHGFLGLARRFSVAVIGGDTARVQGAAMADVMVAGLVPRGRALRRSGAKPGDRIFVSGRLGMAALGLRLLLAGSRAQKAVERSGLRAHLSPQPQCALGRFISQHGFASAMMDLSDGLSLDLQRLCAASRAGAVLFAHRIPAPAIPAEGDAIELALHGGEDYQLLFTVPPARAAKIPRTFRRVPLSCIGEIRKPRGIDLVTADGRRQPLEPRGYDHFSSP